MKSAAPWNQMPPEFWHYVRVLSEHLGYSRRKVVMRHDAETITRGLEALGLSAVPLQKSDDTSVSIGDLVDYFAFQAELIEGDVARHLQSAAQAKSLFEKTADEYTTGYTSQLKMFSKTPGYIEFEAAYLQLRRTTNKKATSGTLIF